MNANLPLLFSVSTETGEYTLFSQSTTSVTEEETEKIRKKYIWMKLSEYMVQLERTMKVRHPNSKTHPKIPINQHNKNYLSFCYSFSIKFLIYFLYRYSFLGKKWRITIL